MLAFHGAASPASEVLLCQRPILRRVLRLSAIFVTEVGRCNCYKARALQIITKTHLVTGVQDQ